MYVIESVIGVVVALAALLAVFVCVFVALGLIIKTAWAIARLLLRVRLPSAKEFNKNKAPDESYGYEADVMYLDNQPVRVLVMLLLPYREWLLLKNSEEFNQIKITDVYESGICENNNGQQVNISFSLLYNDWCLLESSKLFRAIINREIICEKRCCQKQ